MERGPSPTPLTNDGGGKSEGGGGRRARRRTGRRHSRANDTHQPTTTNWREEIIESKKMNTNNQDKLVYIDTN